MNALQQTGANSIEASLEYGIDPQTATVITDPNYTDSLAALGATIQQGVGLGLSVMVRPLVDFLDPNETAGTPYSVGDWRTYYNPGAAGSAGANSFFASYQTMILQEAQVAVANGATSLSIGTELDQITGPSYKGYWDSIIGALRTQDPSLKLTYSADWDDDISPWQWGGTGLPAGTGNLATQVSFSGELDSIGLDVYAPISDASNPTLTQLVAGWTDAPTDATSQAVTGGASLISYFESVAAAVGKPLLFTELGYENANDAASEPAGSSTNVVDSGLQARLYKAFFEAWQQAGNSALTGVYFWNWDPNAAEVGPGQGANFSPQDLPAQSIVTDWFGPGPTLAITGTAGGAGQAALTISGTIDAAHAGLTVSILDGTTVIGTATPAAGGAWSASVTPLSTPGAQTITAQATDSAGKTGTSNAVVTVSVATFENNRTALDQIAGGFGVYDTAANIGTGLAALDADASHITGVTANDTPIVVGVGKFQSYQAILDKVSGGFSFVGQASAIQGDLSAIQADVGHINAITAQNGTVTVSVAAAGSDQPALDKIVGGYGVSDTEANVVNGLAALNADVGHIASIAATDTPVVVGVGKFQSYQGALHKVAGGFSIAGTAAAIETNIATLEADVNNITSISAVDGAISIGVGKFLPDEAALNKIAAGFSIVGQSPAISSNFDALSADSSHVNTLSFADANPALSLTAAQATSDASLVAKVTGNYALNVKNTDGSTTTTGHGSGLTLTGTAGGGDTITGNGASDTFVFQAGFGYDAVTDFGTYLGTSMPDTITLSHTEFANFAAVLADTAYSGSGSAATATIAAPSGGDQLILQHVTASMMQSAGSNFKFT